MTGNEYQELAMRTCNPELTEEQRLLDGVMGLCGESGECIDLVKKHLMQGHPLDREKLAMELSDVCWYIAQTAGALGYKLEDVFQLNIDKLRKRYQEGFDYARSLDRKDE